MIGERVIAYGPPDAKILIVGDVPLHKESSATWEMFKLLEAAGIGRQQCRVTNVCQYYPPGGNLDKWLMAKHEGIIPTTLYNGMYCTPQVMEGIHSLEAEIKRLQPNVVIAFGSEALWALIGKKGINNWRGSILPCSLVEGVKIVPTFHPSFIFKSYEDRVDLISDLRRANDESKFPEIKTPPWVFHLAPSMKQVVEYLGDLGSECIVDIETARRQIKCIGVGRSKTEAMCIPISKNGQPAGYWSQDDEVAIIMALGQTLAKRDVINQNMLYDSFYLSWLYGIKVIPSFDTMIAQGVLFPGRPKSLDYLASMYCKFYQFWKHDSKDWHGYASDNDLWYYNCLDDVYTWEVAENQRLALPALGLQKQFDFEMSLFAPVHNMMLRGVASKPDNRNAMSYKLEIAVQNRWKFLEDVFGHKVNANSPKQLTTLFYIDMGLPVIKNRKTKAPTADDEALQKIAMKEPIMLPVVKAISEARSLRLVKSNFVDIETPDGRLYTSYNPVGTKTFRFSSSSNPMGYGTNLQNILHIEEDDLDAYPADMPNVRELFIPDPGYVLAEFDLSKADLRVMVWQTGERELMEMLKAGVNIYKEAGASIVQMPYRKAKMFIHGTDYGGKPRTMAAHCGITVAQAEQGQARWFGKYPGIKRWHDRVEATLKTTRCVYNKFGFRIMFFDRPDSVLPEALAWDPQSTVAIVINTVLRWIYDEWEAKFDPTVQLLMQVHDSVVVQIREDKLDEIVPKIFAKFNSIVIPFEEPLIIPADCKIGRENWAHREKYVVHTPLTTGVSA